MPLPLVTVGGSGIKFFLFHYPLVTVDCIHRALAMP